jgi:hypothetical protein
MTARAGQYIAMERRGTFDTLLTQVLAIYMLALRRRGSLRGLVDVWIWLGQDIQGGGIAGVQRWFQIALLKIERDAQYQ